MSTLHHEDLLLSIFDEVQEAFPYLDEDKQIEIANQRFEDMRMSYTKNEVALETSLATSTNFLLCWRRKRPNTF